jgi:thioredoxin-related protein
MKYILALSILFSVAMGSDSVDNDLVWHSWEEGYKIAQEEDKTMLVFAFATWCHWCKRMDDKTFSNDEIKSLITKDYIAVKMDVDKEETLIYNSKKYSNNELLGKLMDSDQLAIPTTIIVYPKTSRSKSSGGFKTVQEMKDMLLLNVIEEVLNISE